MDEVGSPRLSGIRQIVRLKEILHKWQSVTLNSNEQSRPRHRSKNTPGGISPQVTNRLKKSDVTCDSDDDGCQSPEPPPDVPKGYLAVYVGEELRRFIIPTSYLSHDVFQVLFEKVEEEYGYDHTGALTIPCEIETFKYLIKCIESKQRAQARDSNPQDAATEE